MVPFFVKTEIFAINDTKCFCCELYSQKPAFVASILWDMGLEVFGLGLNPPKDFGWDIFIENIAFFSIFSTLT